MRKKRKGSFSSFILHTEGNSNRSSDKYILWAKIRAPETWGFNRIESFR